MGPRLDYQWERKWSERPGGAE